MLNNSIRSNEQIPIRKDIKETQKTLYFGKRTDISEHNHHFQLNVKHKSKKMNKL